MTSFADDQRATFALWRDRMAGVSALFGVGAQLAPPIGPFFGHLAASGGLCVAMATKYANDPPDPNYRTAVLPARSVASTVEMREHLNAPDWAIALTTALGDAYRYADAAIRAYERAQGAHRAESQDTMTKRLSETRRYAAIAVEPVGAIADWADGFAVIFNELLPEGLKRPPSPPEAARDLPEATLASLYRARIALTTLDSALQATSLWARHVSEPTEDQMRELASSSRDFAGFLRLWVPSV